MIGKVGNYLRLDLMFALFLQYKLENLTKDEVRIFYRKLDLIFDVKAKPTRLFDGLREYDNEGRDLIYKNSRQQLPTANAES